LDNPEKNIIDFTIVYNRTKGKLYNYVFKMLNEKFLTEDIVQNVFLKFYENFYSIKTTNVEAWLFVTARNEIYSYLRKRKVRNDYKVQFMNSFEFTEMSNENYEAKEIKEILEKELFQLEDELREVFILKEFSGLSYAEITNVLKIDESLVKGRLYRARQKLIKKISKIIK